MIPRLPKLSVVILWAVIAVQLVSTALRIPDIPPSWWSVLGGFSSGVAACLLFEHYWAGRKQP